MAPLFKNIEEKSTGSNYHLVSLLSVVIKILEKLANNTLVDHFEKCGLLRFLLWFQVFSFDCRSYNSCI